MVNQSLVAQWPRVRTIAPGQPGVVFAIFVTALLLDGALTYLGVYTMGIGIEGNPLLATVMQAFGAAPALVGAKVLACFCGSILFLTARYRMLAATAGMYVGVAVGPWFLALNSTIGR